MSSFWWIKFGAVSYLLSCTQQKIFGVLVFSFMYLVSVDPMDRSFLAKSGMNKTIGCLSTEALLPFLYYQFALLQLLVYFNKILTIEWAEPCIGTWIREDCCLPYFFPFASPENAGQCCFSWLILSNFFEQHHSHTYCKFKNLPLSISILAWPHFFSRA